MAEPGDDRPGKRRLAGAEPARERDNVTDLQIGRYRRTEALHGREVWKGNRLRAHRLSRPIARLQLKVRAEAQRRREGLLSREDEMAAAPFWNLRVSASPHAIHLCASAPLCETKLVTAARRSPP